LRNIIGNPDFSNSGFQAEPTLISFAGAEWQFADFNRIPVFFISVAITIPIKKPIRINREPIFILKTDRDFSGKIDPRFYFSNRIAIEKRFQVREFRRNVRSGSAFFVKIDQRFSFQNRSAIFISRSDRDFKTAIAITIPIKNRSGSIGIRFSF
jgi:hypothetical protein